MSGRLDILAFHRVIQPGERYFIPPMAVDAKTFQRLVEKLAMQKRLVALEEGVSLLFQGKLLGQRVAITFDDGYLDNFETARSILKNVDAPATFFIPYAQIESRKPFWWDYLYDVMKRDLHCFIEWVRSEQQEIQQFNVLADEYINLSDDLGGYVRKWVQVMNSLGESQRSTSLNRLVKSFGSYCGQRLLMNWDEINALQAEGFAIGSHTISHIPLTDLTLQDARNEIFHSRQLLGGRIGSMPQTFCYPRGKYTMDLADIVKQAGYSCAVTTRYGTNTLGDSAPFELNRRNIADYQGIRSYFPVAMQMLEISGLVDCIIAGRRTAS